MRKSQEEIALRLTLSTGKSAGRNSSGPIKVFAEGVDQSDCSEKYLKLIYY